jgi:hypothetical protein
MKPKLNRNPHLVHVLEIQRRPVGMVGGVTSREAGQLRREQWFLDELRTRRDDQGHLIWDGETPFTVRVAEEMEIESYRSALTAFETSKQHDPEELFIKWLL